MQDPPPSSPAKSKTRKCPQCGKPRVEAFRPFCSARCRDLDLGKWLNGSYSIPEKDDEYDDQMPPEGARR